MNGDADSKLAGAAADGETSKPRQRFVLEETGFDEVPEKYRKYYRKWKGPSDDLGPNEVLCPVCKVVIRSTRELRPGDRVYCMACFTRFTVTRSELGALEATIEY
ncbi:MAG: hypothetical protein IT386_03465 [Deltaproteobacteria bacterium]|nr:hypothetical protein [Deltaproteobacteria bacterium]